STYCIGVTGGCLLIKETFNAYYDDGTPENVYRCYTNQEPLIDYTTAKAACGPGPCCPPPFETKSDIGCVLLHLEELHWGVAVQHCQAFWPTSHIYMEPPSDGVRAFLQEKGNQAAWVGAHFIGNGKWEYVNKEEVHGSSWSPLEPHQLNVWLLGPPGPWDCVVQTPDLRFKDYPCLAKVRSICKIE
ncbi:C-type lectin fold, partial [Trinorchestia longiramus]